MSTPRSTALADGVAAARTATARGEFATLRCTPASGPVRGTALLVPGFTGSKEDFASILPLLAADGWDVASYDQRGQYETAAVEDDDLTLAGFAADALAVCDALLGPSPCHLLGHSFGGLVAGTAVIAHPQRWRDLTAMCSGLVGFGPSRPDIVAFAESIRTADLALFYEANEEAARAQGIAPEAPEVAAFLKKRFVSNSRTALAEMARQLSTSPSLADDLAATDVPVYVMRGADDDAWPHDVQDALAATVGTQVVVVEGAGHSPAVDRPEDTARVLDAFWR